VCSLDRLWRLLRTAVGVFLDLLTFFRLILRTSLAVAAENLFLRKQLALMSSDKQNPRFLRNGIHVEDARLDSGHRETVWRSSFSTSSSPKSDTCILT